jgi:hypothetical protein
MTTLKGKAADELHDRIVGEERRKQAETLARAKAEAQRTGREPFDLAKLEQLCDTSRDGVMDPPEDRIAHFEYLYYVSHPELATMEELARYVEKSSRW